MDKIKIDSAFIYDLITKSWQDSECIQNQIDSIEVDSPRAAKVIKLLKDLLTSYYVLTGCLENLEGELVNTIVPESEQQKDLLDPPDESTVENSPDIDSLNEFDTETVSIGEPFEYFVDFDEPVSEPLTDDDLYN